MRFVLFSLALVFAICSALSGKEPKSKTDAAYEAALQEVTRAFMEKNYDGVLRHLDQAEKLQAPSPVTLNIRGAVAIEQERFADGQKYCEEALKKDPKYFPARFNLAEIPFLQKKYAQARAGFEKILVEDPRNELVRFRIYLTYLLEKNDARAKQLLDGIPMLNDTPIYYFSHAAWAMSHGKEQEGIALVRAAGSIFPPAQLVLFINTFADIGWLKQVEEPKAAEAPK